MITKRRIVAGQGSVQMAVGTKAFTTTGATLDLTQDLGLARVEAILVTPAGETNSDERLYWDPATPTVVKRTGTKTSGLVVSIMAIGY